MKSFVVAVTAVAAVGALGACGEHRRTPTAAEPTATARLLDNRFRVLLDDTGDLLARAEAADDGTVPAGPDAANRLIGVDATSPLRFAELEETGEHSGRFCLVSDDDTYLALSAGDDALAVLLGDGDCSYAAADAAVVGNLVSGEWTKGAELMGAAEVSDVFPVERFSVQGPEEGDVPEMLDPRLLSDTSALAAAVAEYGHEHHAYPAVPARDLVEKLAASTLSGLGPRTRVFAYRHGRTGYALCVIDGRGNWVRWNRLGAMTDGTYSTPEELAACAAPLGADDAGGD